MHAAHASTSASARSEEHIDDVDAQLPRQDVLIQPWSTTDHRLSSPADAPLSSAVPTSHSALYPAPAIRPTQNTFTSNNGQDVRLSLSVDSRPQNRSPSIYRNVQSPRTLESPALPSPVLAFHHGQVNPPNARPRTNLPVFGTTSKLAAHYGIPTKLPPIPRVNGNNINININNNNNRPPVPRFSEVAPSSSSLSTTINLQYQQHSVPSNINQISDFQSLMVGYMNMLDNNTDENGSASGSAVPPSSAGAPFALEPTVEEAAQSISSALFGGAGDFTASTWDEYLTSPFLDDESPFESLLDTPAGAPGLHDFFTSPAIADSGVNALDNFADLPLLGSVGYSENGHDFSKMSLTNVSPPSVTASGSASPVKAAAPSLEGLYTMSPATPALEPSSMQISPLVNNVSMSSPNPNTAGRKKKAVTGTRKNVTPESLVPLEAPTQPRNYVIPSVTSRKAIPAVFARKRSRSAAFGGDEEDELAGSDGGILDLPANATEAEAIAAKRRQNTLAARRSRKRKLEYQRELEESLEAERREKEMWRERAMMLRAQVIQLGMPEPFRET